MSRLEEIARRYAELDCNDAGKEGRRARAIFEDHAPADIRDLLAVAEAVDEAGPWLNALVMLSGDDADHEVWRRVQAACRKLEGVSDGTA